MKGLFSGNPLTDSAVRLAAPAPDYANYWAGLTESDSLAMAAQIQFTAIQTSLQPAPIATAYVQTGYTQTSFAQTSPESAQGTPLVLIHGFDSSLLEYRRLLPKLAPMAKVSAWDLLGFGFTERPMGLRFSAAAIKNHLYQTWQTLVGQPAIWVGASMGGAAVLEFALSYPEAVSQLVLIDSVGVQPGPPGHLLVPPLGWLATQFLRSPRVRQQISRNAYHDPSFATADAQACAASHLQVPGWRNALIQFTKSGGYPSLVQRLGQITFPSLIIWGESDRILGTKPAYQLQQAIPNSKLVWIPQAGHVPHLEKPTEVAEQIQAWLA